MEIFTPFIMCALFVLAAFCFWRLSVKLSSYAARKKILAGKGSAGKEATSVVLISHFGEFAVRPNVCVPIRTGKFHVYSKVDNIVVLPSCIAVVQVETLRGQIFCGSGAVWHQSLRLTNGTSQETDFDNPIINNERNIIALAQIFEREKITPPPIYNIILFSSDKVIFSVEAPAEVYTLSKAIEKMKALSSKKNAKEKKIPFKERLRIIRAIKKYSVSPAKAKAHNAKVMRAAAK
ncbi:MAG: NERD domain-containing protein [Clostridia bacterium]|nr:NERD domain-containing protein [Clostridia bacterium]